jgi:predicted PurR-regulated permease PerM
MAESTRHTPATALWVLAVLAILFFLRAAQTVLIPIALAVLLSYALEPIVEWLVRHRLPRAVAVAAVMLTVVGSAAGAGYFLRDDAVRMVKALPDAAHRAREMVASQLGVSPEAVQGAVSSRAGDGGSGNSGSTGTAGDTPGSMLARATSVLFAFAGHVVVIVFLLFFLLLSGHHVRNRVIEISGPDVERRRMVATIVRDIDAQIQRYLLVLLVTGSIVVAATWIVLAWLGVQNSPMWAVLAGLFNAIPYFGPVVVSGGLFLVGIVQGGGMTQALQMSGAAIVITSLEGWLITPPLMGKAERMSPLAVFLGLMLWTWVWGAWGTLLAVPMLVVIKSVADHIESLRPVGRLMAP